MRLRGREIQVKLPSVHDWRTTDAQEVEKRRLRALEDEPRIRNLNPEMRIFSNFEVHSPSGMTYQVEVREPALRQYSCSCTDFHINGLGTCKHVEAVLAHLETRFPKEFAKALKEKSDRIDILPDPARNTLLVERGLSKISPRYRSLFETDGYLYPDVRPEEAFSELRKSRSRKLRLSQDIGPWLETRKRVRERKILRREYEEKVHAGIFPQHETKEPLYPYQREGMLHLADEMGLGKTIQAIAACPPPPHRPREEGPRRLPRLP